MSPNRGFSQVIGSSAIGKSISGWLVIQDE
jgi:hypothetical protein